MTRRRTKSDVFAAIADPTRRGLLDLLGRGEQTVLALAGHFAMTLSAAGSSRIEPERVPHHDARDRSKLTVCRSFR